MEKISDQIVVRELSGAQEMFRAYEIVKQRYKEITKKNFEAQISEMIEMNDFKMIGAFLDDKIVGVTGYWVLRMLYCGRYIQLSSFIVDEEKRGSGIGKKILCEVEKIGKKLNCEKIILDSFTENKKSHSLYFREGFHIRGFHFIKNII